MSAPRARSRRALAALLTLAATSASAQTTESVVLPVQRGTFFDPPCGLVFLNDRDNKPWFLGIGNDNAVGFASMEQAIPLAEKGIGLAATLPTLKPVFGADAVAGAHGRNTEELVCRTRQTGART